MAEEGPKAFWKGTVGKFSVKNVCGPTLRATKLGEFL